MKNIGLISIVLTLYNKAPYIEETIFSIYKQTYTNWELIIVDDCSTDWSFEIAKSFCEKLWITKKCKFIKNEKNLWVAKTFERWLKEVKWDWISMCDWDDILMKNKLEENLKFCIENNIDFCYSDLTAINEQNNILYLSYFKHHKINLNNNQFEDFLIRWNAIWTSIFFWKKVKDDLIKAWFPTWFPTPVYQDWWCLLIASIIENVKIWVIKEQLVFYRRCEGCITRDNYNKNNYEILSERNNILETEIMIFNYITYNNIKNNGCIASLKDRRIKINKLLIKYIKWRKYLLFFVLLKEIILFWKKIFYYRLLIITLRKIILTFSE